MSFETTAWAMQQRCGGSLAKLVLLTLSDHHNRDTGLCCPKIKVLAEETEMSERSVRNQLAKLRDRGLIAWENQYAADGSLRSSSYRLLMPGVAPGAGGGQASPAEGTAPGAGGGQAPRAGGQAPPAGRTAPRAEQEEPGTSTRNLNQEEQLMLTADAASDWPPAGRTLAEDFDTWWRHYPRKVSKDHALQAYKHARKTVPAERLLNAVRDFAADPNLPAARFIPHPATWLNGGRWQDGPLAPLHPLPQRSTTDERFEMALAAGRELELELAARGDSWQAAPHAPAIGGTS